MCTTKRLEQDDHNTVKCPNKTMCLTQWQEELFSLGLCAVKVPCAEICLDRLLQEVITPKDPKDPLAIKRMHWCKMEGKGSGRRRHEGKGGARRRNEGNKPSQKELAAVEWYKELWSQWQAGKQQNQGDSYIVEMCLIIDVCWHRSTLNGWIIK